MIISYKRSYYCGGVAREYHGGPSYAGHVASYYTSPSAHYSASCHPSTTMHVVPCDAKA